MSIQKVAVIGAGTMGLGIAQVTALAGYEVLLYDLISETLEKAIQQIEINLQKGIERGKLDEVQMKETLSRITLSDHEDDLVADLIIEAVVENLNVKRKVFTHLEEINSSMAILASNTSSIPITRIAAELKNPDRFIGIHFFNPAHIMKLVEIISGVATNEYTREASMTFINKIGKVGVFANDSPGFIVNRVARHFYVESLKLLEEDIADVESLDDLMESCGFRMGPFRLMDLIGVDTNFSVTQSMFQAFHMDPKFRPSRIQQQKVDAGHHGRKSGKGFYKY